MKKTFLNPKRLRYAWIAGGAMWLGWAISIGLGSGKMDLAGQATGTDYVQFYAAGTTLRLADSVHLYDFNYQDQLEQNIIGKHIEGQHAFITPPFFAWVFVPLSIIPYEWSFAIWSLFGLASLWASFRWLEVEHPAGQVAWSLSWFPVFAAISFGQNSLLSLAILSLTYRLWRHDRRWMAGLVCGLLLYKPQLILGIGLLWLLEWRRDWRALAGLAVGGAILAGVSLVSMPEASLDFLQFSRLNLPSLLSQEGFPIWHAHTPRAFWLLLLPGEIGLAEVLGLLCTAVGIVGYVYFWRQRRSQHALVFAGAICLTIWATPHAMIYDWAILLIPAILCWEQWPFERVRLKIIFALVWLTTFVSGPLTFLQLKLLPIAVQISVPVLGYALILGYKLARSSQGIPMSPPPSPA